MLCQLSYSRITTEVGNEDYKLAARGDKGIVPYAAADRRAGRSGDCPCVPVSSTGAVQHLLNIQRRHIPPHRDRRSGPIHPDEMVVEAWNEGLRLL